MQEGFYARKELKITIYERENSKKDVIVVVLNDTHPDEPVVLTGKHARNLILGIVDCIDMVDKEKES